eukprot:11234823-Ditylum_brightwellii.AAC.1
MSAHQEDVARTIVLLGQASSDVVMPSSVKSLDVESHVEGYVKSFALQYYHQCSPSKQVHILMSMCERLDLKELNTSIKVLMDKGVLKTQDIKPTSKHYKMEIQWRRKLVGEL